MKAVFLDRDGTVTVEKGHLGNPDDLELHAGAADAIRRLREAGWSVFVVTNQSGVARGMFTEEELASVHFRMVAMLGAEGASIDGLYSCPHHPEGTV
ncbi:MAG TPA: HAD-IIIA family hydrolase, partial [Planctomycetota bacterium]|nr:HAD-IIIA family hydrolase [Planctomycetota bacterium]